MLLDLDPFWNIPLMHDHFFNDPRLIYSVRIPEALCGVSEWEPGGPIISLITGITLRVKSIIEDCDDELTLKFTDPKELMQIFENLRKTIC